jgi:hypothetical protein
MVLVNFIFFNQTHLKFKSILIDKTSSDEEDSFMIIRRFVFYKIDNLSFIDITSAFLCVNFIYDFLTMIRHNVQYFHADSLIQK